MNYYDYYVRTMILIGAIGEKCNITINWFISNLQLFINDSVCVLIVCVPQANSYPHDKCLYLQLSSSIIA